MSITPNGLAVTLRRAAKARETVEAVSDTTDHPSEGGAVMFHVQDEQGGILRVTINQFMEPIR